MSLTSNGRSVASRPPSRFLHYLPATALLIDTVVMVVIGLVAIVGRRELGFFRSSVSVEDSLSVAGPLIILGWLLMLALRGSYKTDVFGAGTDEFRRVFNASLMAGGLTGVGCYLVKFDLSRGFFMLAFGLGVPALLFGRAGLRAALQGARRRGGLRQRVLLTGSRSHVDEIASVLRRETWLGYEIVGALTPEYDLSEETASGIPVLGNTDDVVKLARISRADTILFAGGSTGSSNQLRKVVWELEQSHVQVVVVPSVTDISSDRVKVRPVGGLPLIHIDPPTWLDASRWGKRAFDIAGSGALIVLFAPLLMLSAFQVKAHDRGPIFFRQTRTGKDGEEFACLKFRTMVVDAEARLAQLHEQSGYSGGLFKMKDDPRITAPGKWLRRFSIDELPQLFNVFRGDMSLVGPRPPLPSEVADYDDDTIRRLRVRPGMTGLWQVSGRSDLSWHEAIRLDLYYVDNWSMLQDLSILARTLGAVTSSRGAY
ncbi:sugar transferase [Nocardioides acrostichi]|uniref:Sugar transferase n=1 Tax=Nocardioides acrostichi TaxID=2784339 RepID=A0A930UZZ5_9ACTN|nr:sugar transferase [Nocardioides acrostichi]MBF4164008.1 sugar transferase [Nocardioides acrostichi]